MSVGGRKDGLGALPADNAAPQTSQNLAPGDKRAPQPGHWMRRGMSARDVPQSPQNCADAEFVFWHRGHTRDIAADLSCSASRCSLYCGRAAMQPSLTGLSHLGIGELGKEFGEEGGVPAGTFEFAAHGTVGGFELGQVEGEATQVADVERLRQPMRREPIEGQRDLPSLRLGN